jgi:serine/threonine-protein kinase RsbW
VKTITKTFAGNYQNLAAIGEFVVKIATDQGFSSKEVYAIQTAVDEACANIIDHAYKGEDLGEIKITITSFPDRIEIFIEDTGESFAPEEVPAPDITSPLEIRKERGLGVFFIRKLMDEATFDCSSEDCNTLTLVKFKRS